MFRPHGPSGQTIHQTLRGQKKSISAPARSRTMGTGLMKSPTPAFYGDVPSLSLPVDWIMPNEDAEIVWLHTSPSPARPRTKCMGHEASTPPRLCA